METMEFKPNTQVVLWYIGARGLPTTGAQWYKKNILTPLKGKVDLQLYSLAAWLSLSDQRVTPSRVDKLEKPLRDRKWSVLSSADFFTWLATEKRPDLCSYVQKEILSQGQRPSIWKVSEGKESGRTLAELFPDGSALLKPILEKDTGLCYGALQYLELFWIVNQLGQKPVCFLLPNDEEKYYASPSFADDLAALCQNSSVTIRCFEYGEGPSCRPYSGKGKRVKPSKLEEVLS